MKGLAFLISIKLEEAKVLKIAPRDESLAVRDGLIVMLANADNYPEPARGFLKRARSMLSRYASSSARQRSFSVADWIDFHVAPSERFGSWIHTHGLYFFRKPEIEISGVARYQREVQRELGDLAQYLASGAEIRDGDTASSAGGRYFARFALQDAPDIKQHFAGPTMEIIYLQRSGVEILTPISRAAAVAFHRYGVSPEFITDLVTQRTIPESER